MLLLPSSLHLPPETLKLISPCRFPTAKNPVLIPGLAPERRPFRRLMLSDHKTMAELARIGGFHGSDGSEEEAEVIPSTGGSNSGGGFNLAAIESLINRMSKWLVASIFGLVILWKHDAEALWGVMGAVVNSWISITLKRILNHQRPVSALRSDPGMPSSHAQSIFYAAVLGVISLFQWMGINFFTVPIGTFILASGSYLTWLRVSQQLHTISQVIVGAILGSICAITWFWLWHAFVFSAFVSSIWVRILVVLGSVTFCAAFLLYVVQHWLIDED